MNSVCKLTISSCICLEVNLNLQYVLRNDLLPHQDGLWSSYNLLVPTRSVIFIRKGCKVVTKTLSGALAHRQTQTHQPCGPSLMLLWQPISFDTTALETLTPH